MTLKSQLFSNEPQLEAVAFVDHVNILPWASGTHVARIQNALIEVDHAVISAEDRSQSLYGPSTARAVIAFKRRRNIVDRSGQIVAEEIIDEQTIAALDRELLARENITGSQIKLQPLTSQKAMVPRSPLNSASNLMLNFGLTGSPVTAPQARFDNVAIDIKVFGVGSFQIFNGIGGVLVLDPNIAVIFDPDPTQLTATNFVPVTKDPQVFNVRGINPGLTIITLQKPFAPLLGLPQPVVVIVRAQTKARKVPTPGIQHNHRASGKWSEIQKDPKNAGFGENSEGGNTDGGIFDGLVLTPICKLCSTPMCVIDKVIFAKFGSLPVAKTHIDFYLTGGGRDFNEDTNIAVWIRSDSGIRSALRREVESIADKSGRKRKNIEFTQGQYDDQDFRNAFGAIDRIDIEFDFDLDECTVWFQDRYEWHPVYEGLYDRQAGDNPRSTNCIHAAFVEMKKEGAQDYWMKGEATVPMQDIFR